MIKYFVACCVSKRRQRPMDGVRTHDRGRENQVRHAWATSRCTEPTRPRPGQALSDHHTAPTHIFEAWIAIYVRQKFLPLAKGLEGGCTLPKIHQVRHAWATSWCAEPTRPHPGQALSDHHTVPTHIFEAWIAIYVRQKIHFHLQRGWKGGYLEKNSPSRARVGDQLVHRADEGALGRPWASTTQSPHTYLNLGSERTGTSSISSEGCI